MLPILFYQRAGRLSECGAQDLQRWSYVLFLNVALAFMPAQLSRCPDSGGFKPPRARPSTVFSVVNQQTQILPNNNKITRITTTNPSPPLG